MNDQLSIVAKWKNETAKLTKGRHLVGNSAASAIQVAPPGSEICATLTVDVRPVLKCVSKYPTLFAEGRKLRPGEEVVLGDQLDLTVGTTTVHLAFETSRKPMADATDFNIDELKHTLSRALLQALDLKEVNLAALDSDDIKERARLRLRKLIADLKELPAEISSNALERQVYDEVLGMGPLEPLLDDPEVTEIMVNRRDQIFVERAGRITMSEVNFSSDRALLHVIERIVSKIGRRIDQSSPIVDARLLDGSRVNAIIAPLAINGPALTIRRFSKEPISVEQLIRWKSLTQPMADFLRLLVRSHKNIIISGGTGSGKTTLLNALSNFIPDNERIITVEDAAELQLQQSHVVSLETRPANLEGKGQISIRDLVKNTLRMRPDRIIVGECRGGEALDMLQAMNTGHDGSMTTAHANSPEDMLRRLETMVLMAGMELPLSAVREQVASALTVVVQQARLKSGARLVTHITWVNSLDRATGVYRIRHLVRRDKAGKVFWDQAALNEFWSGEDMPGQAEVYTEKDAV